MWAQATGSPISHKLRQDGSGRHGQPVCGAPLPSRGLTTASQRTQIAAEPCGECLAIINDYQRAGR